MKIVMALFLSVFCFSALANSHSPITPYSGSQIQKTIKFDYNLLEFPSGKLGAKGLPTETLYGAVLVEAFTAPKNTSVKAVYQSYKAALENSGAEIELDCHAQKCGEEFLIKMVHETYLYPAYNSVLDIYNLEKDFYVISAKLPISHGDTGKVGVVLVLAQIPYLNGEVAIVQTTLTPRSLEPGLVTIDPDFTPETPIDYSQRKPAKKDAAGAKDHVLISRFPGSYISRQNTLDYTQYLVPMGVAEENDRPIYNLAEGKLSVTNYKVPKDMSLLQVVHNYRQAIDQSGMEVIFECDKSTCRYGYLSRLLKGTSYEKMYDLDINNMDNSNFNIIIAELKRQDKPSVFVNLTIDKRFPDWETSVVQDVLEIKSMNDELISVDRNQISDSIKTQGKIALYGIHFDVNKAIIRAESGSQLQSIADFLNQDESVQLYVVGHTDNTGNYAHNLKLSEKRARAVVDALVKDFEISNNRLFAVGVGPVAPIEANSSEYHQAKNRRVELVLKSSF